MNLDDPFAVANDAFVLADMLGEDFASADVVDAVESAAVAVVVVLALGIADTGAEVKLVKVAELVGCRSADSACMRTHSEEAEVWNEDVA